MTYPMRPPLPFASMTPPAQVSQPVTQYGYGTTPGSGPGYYEQQTPGGSFAAADVNRAGPSSQFYNPYLGMSSYNGAGSAGQATAAVNPYFGANNPYTAQAVNSASEAAARNYNQFIAPQRDAQMARSGSFGNTGVQQMQMEDQRNLQGTLGNIANNAYMQDLFRQQDMGESAANRMTGTSQFNVGARANDLNRNLMAGQFDANLAQQGGMFNAGQNNAMRMFDAGQANNMNQFNASAGNNMLENYRNRSQQGDQFNQNMDFQTWMANNQNMRNGNRDMMDFMNTMMGWQNQGINAATNQQNTDLGYYQQFADMFRQFGGQGGTATQNLQGNPMMAFLGTLMGMYGNGRT